MKNLSLMIFGYILISFLVNHVSIVEKQGQCDAFCPQSISK